MTFTRHLSLVAPHATIQELVDKGTIQNDSFVFSFVRNPFDRLVSAYFYLKSGGYRPADKQDWQRISHFDGFQGFVRGLYQDRELLDLLHLRPQSYWLHPFDRLNFLGHYETLERDCRILFKVLGLEWKGNFPHILRSKHDPYRSYYTTELTDMVREIYASDMHFYNSTGGI